MILKKEETDHAYIENCFGRSLYSKQELARTEKELCKGNHAGCHVWFTDGKYIPKEKISAENRYLRNQAQLQMERKTVSEYYHTAFVADKKLYDGSSAAGYTAWQIWTPGSCESVEIGICHG